MVRPFIYDEQTRQRAIQIYRERLAAAPGESLVKARRHVENELGIKQATLYRWIREDDGDPRAPSRDGRTASTSPGSQTVPRGSGRGALIAGAIGEIADLGVGGMRLREVAHRAGISVGSVAYHFPDRMDLVDAAVDTFAENLATRCAAAADPAAAAEVLRDFYSDREASLFWAETRIHATRDDHAGDVADQIHAALAGLVRRATDKTVPAAGARAIVATLNTAAVDTACTHRDPGPYSRAMKQAVRRALTGTSAATPAGSSITRRQGR
ncbi:MAG: TetR/AcrR family transcriptional regulator [Gordonia polyisoprenivorans]|nr:TetR/AcrR family transcriptional regulator [Gordonia polyisoprenivorans]